MSNRLPRQKVKRILKSLEQFYDRPVWSRGGKGVDVLVGTILSQNTSGSNSSEGFRRLKRRFRTWSKAANAPVSQIEKCIRPSGLSRIKAPRIRKILKRIHDDRGKIDLEFLADWKPQQATEYLLRFDGVGPKTALCVLMFSFGMHVFPVDTHIHRITKRLGLLPDRIGAEKAHEILKPLIPPRQRYAMHVLLIRHGRRICRARNPLCDECVLIELCHYPQRRISKNVEP